MKKELIDLEKTLVDSINVFKENIEKRVRELVTDIQDKGFDAIVYIHDFGSDSIEISKDGSKVCEFYLKKMEVFFINSNSDTKSSTQTEFDKYCMAPEFIYLDLNDENYVETSTENTISEELFEIRELFWKLEEYGINHLINTSLPAKYKHIEPKFIRDVSNNIYVLDLLKHINHSISYNVVNGRRELIDFFSKDISREKRLEDFFSKESSFLETLLLEEVISNDMDFSDFMITNDDDFKIDKDVLHAINILRNDLKVSPEKCMVVLDKFFTNKDALENAEFLDSEQRIIDKNIDFFNKLEVPVKTEYKVKIKIFNRLNNKSVIVSI